MTKVEIPEVAMNKIITEAVVLQLPQDVRDELIAKAINEYLLAPDSNYGKQTKIQKQVNEAVDRAVRVIFDELLVKEPYRSRLVEVAKKELNEVFEGAQGNLTELIGGIIESATRSALGNVGTRR